MAPSWHLTSRFPSLPPHVATARSFKYEFDLGALMTASFQGRNFQLINPQFDPAMVSAWEIITRWTDHVEWALANDTRARARAAAGAAGRCRLPAHLANLLAVACCPCTVR